MRIINIIDTLDPNSGVFDVLKNFSQGLQNENIQIDFVYFFETKNSMKEELIFEGHRILKLDFKKIILNKNKVNKEIKEFINLDNRNYTIVHNHVLLFSNFIMPYFKKNNISLSIGHAHSSDISNSVAKRIRNKPLLFNIDKHYDVYFGCSKVSIETWFNKRNKEKDTIIIPNPVDCRLISNIIDSYTLISNEDIIILGTVGRIVKEKNQEFLFDVVKYVSYEFPDKKIVLKIIGEGPLKEKLKKTYKNKFSDLNIIFYDYMIKEKLYKEMLSFDYFLLPSLKEGLGISLIEAQMLGISSIASYGIPVETDIGSLERVPLSKELWAQRLIYSINNELKVAPNINNIYCVDRASEFLLKNYLYFLE